MIIISHRGNIHGPNPDRENDPVYIQEAIEAGFDVEVDLYADHEKICFGHDKCGYIVTDTWLLGTDSLLVHAKNVAALEWLSDSGLHYFSHQQDKFSMTSFELIWLHDLSIPATPFCIIPLITMEAIKAHRNFNVHAVCTDYPVKLKEMLSHK